MRIGSRRTDKAPSHGLRRSIYHFILENPAAHLREIRRIFNVSLSAVVWHLRILEKSELIISKKIGNRLTFFPDDFDAENSEPAGMKSKPVKEVLACLEEEGVAHKGNSEEAGHASRGYEV